MKTLFSFFLFPFALGAQTNVLYVPVGDLGIAIQKNVPVKLVLLDPNPRTVIAPNGTTYAILQNPIQHYTDADGKAWFTNVPWGVYEIDAGNNPATQFTPVTVTTNTIGPVNAMTLYGTSANIPSTTNFYYTAQQIDALFADGFARLGNAAFGNTNTMTVALATNAQFSSVATNLVASANVTNLNLHGLFDLSDNGSTRHSIHLTASSADAGLYIGRPTTSAGEDIFYDDPDGGFTFFGFSGKGGTIVNSSLQDLFRWTDDGHFYALDGSSIDATTSAVATNLVAGANLTNITLYYPAEDGHGMIIYQNSIFYSSDTQQSMDVEHRQLWRGTFPDNASVVDWDGGLLNDASGDLVFDWFNCTFDKSAIFNDSLTAQSYLWPGGNTLAANGKIFYYDGPKFLDSNDEGYYSTGDLMFDVSDNLYGYGTFLKNLQSSNLVGTVSAATNAQFSGIATNALYSVVATNAPDGNPIASTAITNGLVAKGANGNVTLNIPSDDTGGIYIDGVSSSYNGGAIRTPYDFSGDFMDFTDSGNESGFGFGTGFLSINSQGTGYFNIERFSDDGTLEGRLAFGNDGTFSMDALNNTAILVGGNGTSGNGNSFIRVNTDHSSYIGNGNGQYLGINSAGNFNFNGSSATFSYSTANTLAIFNPSKNLVSLGSAKVDGSGVTNVNSGSLHIQTNAAPSNVTIGTTPPDLWMTNYINGTAYYVPMWKAH